MGRVKGLCGNYNGITDDDFLTRTGSIESRPSVFGESWKLSDSCPDIQQDVPDETTTPCGTVNGVSFLHQPDSLLNSHLSYHTCRYRVMSLIIKQGSTLLVAFHQDNDRLTTKARPVAPHNNSTMRIILTCPF